MPVAFLVQQFEGELQGAEPIGDEHVVVFGTDIGGELGLFVVFSVPSLYQMQFSSSLILGAHC